MRFKNQWMIGLLLGLCSFTSVAEINPADAMALYGSEIEALKQNIDGQLKHDLAMQDAQLNQAESHQPEIIAFVSFSMPEASIKQWLGEAHLLKASLNIRGLIDNNMPKTMAKVQQLIKENHEQGGLNIDPELFEFYDIQKVPAVVVRYGASEDSAFDIVYGASSIKEALQWTKTSNPKVLP